MDTKNLIPYVLHFRQVQGSKTLELDPAHRSGGGTNPTNFYFGKAVNHVAIQLVWTGEDVINLQVHDSQTWSNISTGKGKAKSKAEPFVSDILEVPMTTVGGGVGIRLVLDEAANVDSPYIAARATVKVIPMPGYDEVR